MIYRIYFSVTIHHKFLVLSSVWDSDLVSRRWMIYVLELVKWFRQTSTQGSRFFFNIIFVDKVSKQLLFTLFNHMHFMSLVTDQYHCRVIKNLIYGVRLVILLSNSDIFTHRSKSVSRLVQMNLDVLLKGLRMIW